MEAFTALASAEVDDEGVALALAETEGVSVIAWPLARGGRRLQRL